MQMVLLSPCLISPGNVMSRHRYGFRFCTKPTSAYLDLFQSIKISWKDPENALTKLHPRVVDDEAEADDLPADSGSFFNFFEMESDPFDVSVDEISFCFHRLTFVFIDWYAHRERDLP